MLKIGIPLRNIAMPAPNPNRPAPAPKYGLSDNPATTSVMGMMMACTCKDWMN